MKDEAPHSISAVASAIAAALIRRRLEDGATIEIPSLGVTIGGTMTDWHTRTPAPGRTAAHRQRGWCVEAVEMGWRPDGMAEWWVKDSSENTTLAWGLATTVEQAMSAADDAAGRLEG